jgi:DNA-binding XRE family transcriptional regulator
MTTPDLSRLTGCPYLDGAKLRAARIAAGYTQETAARALRMSTATVGYHELNIRTPRLGTIVRLCVLYRAAIEDLVSWREPRRADPVPSDAELLAAVRDGTWLNAQLRQEGDRP